MESGSNVLELLFKLASLGVAGISVIAIYYCAIIVKNLPDDIPKARENLTKRFLNLCWAAIIVCGISGCLNLYLNYKKIQRAKNETAFVKDEYGKQVNELNSSKAVILKEYNSLLNILSHQNSNSEVNQAMNNLHKNIDALQLKRVEDLLKKNNPQN